MIKRNSRKLVRKRRPYQRCQFCEHPQEIDYKNRELLSRYVSERGKIQGSINTDICSRHQRHLTTAIKRARYMALLPYIVRAK